MDKSTGKVALDTAPAPGAGADQSTSAKQLLRVKGVGKRFSRDTHGPAGRFRRAVLREFGIARASDEGEFWALKDVSFGLARGECLGVMGLNGAGKSTLLSILAGQLAPDTGGFEIDGKIGALAALGAGLNPSLTGRENLYLRGALMGVSRAAMTERIEAIIDFSELQEVIDSPLSGYSSGMRARLSFALAAWSDSDLLLLDEVLAVGDFVFRQKCIDRMQTLRNRTAMILVSHSISDIYRFCTRALLLERGEVRFYGAVDEATAIYLRSGARESGGEAIDADLPFLGAKIWNTDKVEMFDVVEENRVANTVELCFRMRLKIDAERLIAGCSIWTSDGLRVTGFASDEETAPRGAVAGELIEWKLSVDIGALNPGSYHLTANLQDGAETLVRAGFRRIVIPRDRVLTIGAVQLEHQWDLGPAETSGG
ncbi:MAG: ABC transporter ATP-binding protein [Pseudomonadota bacterium]